jgi:hypothetical protein
MESGISSCNSDVTESGAISESGTKDSGVISMESGTSSSDVESAGAATLECGEAMSARNDGRSSAARGTTQRVAAMRSLLDRRAGLIDAMREGEPCGRDGNRGVELLYTEIDVLRAKKSRKWATVLRRCLIRNPP